MAETAYLMKNLNIEEKTRFVNAIENFDTEFDLIGKNKKVMIDAKSILGVLGMDLSDGAKLLIHNPSKEIEESIKDFILERA